MKNEKNNDIDEIDLETYNKFPRLYCRTLRRHVFHGVKEDEDIQTIKCLSCGDEYELHIKGRNKIESSLWDTFTKYRDQVNLDPPLEKRPKKRWNPGIIFFRGKK